MVKVVELKLTLPPSGLSVPVPSVAAPSLNVTVPDAGPPGEGLPPTMDVKVTGCPTLEGFTDELSEVAVGVVDAGVTLFDTADEALFPTAFVASTVQVTAVPFVRPVTVIGEAGAEVLRVPQVAV